MADQTRVICVLLPDKKKLDITVGLKSRGHEITGQLSKLLGIKELHVFGLGLEKGNEFLFLDLEKKLSTYFPKAWKHNTLQEVIVLHLKVQYYVGNGGQIVEEKARSLYYADLKGRVLNSQCHWQEGLFFQLAAYAIQADLGDWREGKERPYFNPHDYFPSWILDKHGCNYVEQHTPALHRELLGVCVCDAVLLFIQEVCRLNDVPVTFYSMSKGKRQRASVLMGLGLTGLDVYEIISGERQLLYELVWPSIDRITFQGKRFEIRADVLPESKLLLYTHSALHSQHLLKHMSNSHRLHLNTKLSVKQQQLPQHRAGGMMYREMFVRDKNEADTEDSEDELPPVKSYLDRVMQLQVKPKELASKACKNQQWDTSWEGTARRSGVPLAYSAENELCVDEPEEMFVDDLDEIMSLTELLEGVSVDGPVMPASHWIGITMEMKQVLQWRACSLSLDWHRKSVEALHLSHPFNGPEEDTSYPLTNHITQEVII